MHPVKRFLFLLTLLGACLGMPVHGMAADNAALAAHQEREAYAKDFAQAVITILHDPKKSYGDRKNILRQSFSDSVDIDWIAKFALGRAWRDATDAQRERYMSLYRKFLTETYVTNFAENPGKSIYAIKIYGVSDEKDNDFVVHTQMQLMNRVNLKVDYRVCDKDGHYKVRDFVIENVSLIATHRAEFTELAGTQGVDGVIRKLEESLSGNAAEMKLSMK